MLRKLPQGCQLLPCNLGQVCRYGHLRNRERTKQGSGMCH
jgi:hypothetical protein